MPSAKHSRNLGLYLAIACFLGIILTFFFDAYIGIYDTIYITVGERESKVESDYWQRTAKSPLAGVYHVYTESRSEPVSFRYRIENRHFSSYSTPIEVSVWKSEREIMPLLSTKVEIKPFDDAEVGWRVDPSELNLPEDRANYTVKIKTNRYERKVIVRFPRPIEPCVR